MSQKRRSEAAIVQNVCKITQSLGRASFPAMRTTTHSSTAAGVFPSRCAMILSPQRPCLLKTLKNNLLTA